MIQLNSLENQGTSLTAENCVIIMTITWQTGWVKSHNLLDKCPLIIWWNSITVVSHGLPKCLIVYPGVFNYEKIILENFVISDMSPRRYKGSTIPVLSPPLDNNGNPLSALPTRRLMALRGEDGKRLCPSQSSHKVSLIFSFEKLIFWN